MNPPKFLPIFDVEPWEIEERWPFVMMQPGAPILPERWALMLIWDNTDICIWLWNN
jgi:hypothetical protein